MVWLFHGRRLPRCGFRAWAAAGLLAVAGSATAGSFNISPLRADLRPGHRASVLTLKNLDDAPVVVEVHLYAWSQEDGQEHLEETHDILATPAVLQMAGNSEQIVRVALRRESDTTRELTYRIVLQEVPAAAPAGFTGLRVALSLSVPVFVAPLHPAPLSPLAWDVAPLPDGEVEVAALNSGNTHIKINDFAVVMPGSLDPVQGLVAKYVLPGSRMTWRFKADTAPLTSGPIVVRGHSDQGEFTADAAFRGL